MEKRISYSQFQSVKCVAKACDPLVSKRDKLKEKIKVLASEYEDLTTQINSFQAGIVKVIGLPVEQLVKKVVEPGVDVNGQPKKTTKYLPTNIVSYDEAHKQYVINLPLAEESATPTSVEENKTETPKVSEEKVEETSVEAEVSITEDNVPESSTEEIFN